MDLVLARTMMVPSGIADLPAACCGCIVRTRMPAGTVETKFSPLAMVGQPWRRPSHFKLR